MTGSYRDGQAEWIEAERPSYYGGADDPYEAIKVIEAWGLGFHLGNVIKYIRRAGKKDRTPDGVLSDLRKARWYLERYIEIVQSQDARPIQVPRPGEIIYPPGIG
jgi:hypothetical protein